MTDRRSRWTHPLAGALVGGVGLIGAFMSPVIEVVPAVPLEFLPQYALMPLPSVLLAALAAVALTAAGAAESRRSAIATGLIVGLTTVFVVAVVHSAAQARTMQLRGPYALWAMAYVLVVASLVAGLGLRAVAVGRPLLGWGLLTAAASAPIVGTFVRDATVAGMATVGLALGLLSSVGARQISAAARYLARSPRVTLAIILAATFMTRLGFGLQLLSIHGPGMGFAVASDDGDTYYRYAQLIMREGWAGALSVFANGTYSPGYPVALALMLSVGASSFVVVIVAQALLAALSAGLVTSIATHAGGRLVGFLAGGLFAAHQNLIQVQATLTTEALLLPALLIYTLAIIRSQATDSRRWVLIGGASMAVAILTRSVAAVFLLAGISWLIASQTPVWQRRSVLQAVALILLAATAVVPTAYATTMLSGSTQVASQATALSWEIGTGTWEAVAPSNRPLVERGLSPFRDLSGTIARFVADPLPVLGFYGEVVPRRLITLVFRPNFGAFDPLTIVSSGAEKSMLAELATTLTALALGVGVVSGMGQHGSYGAVTRLLVALIAVYLVLFSLVFAPLHPVRYRVPIEPYLISIQALGIVLLFRWAKHAMSGRSDRK